MNPILTLTRNNLPLTRRCIESVRRQDIFTTIHVIDNGSEDRTLEWLSEQPDIRFLHYDENKGVSAGWNEGLRVLFEHYAAEYALVIGNDTVLPSWFCSTLLSFHEPFVTGVAVDDMARIQERPLGRELTPNPDFSAFLIRRECWEKVGQFDERMKHYCSDCDYHIRAHRLGVQLWKAPVEFYHERSSTLRLAQPAEQSEILEQANKDRAVFRELYGCLPGEKAYEQMFEVEAPQ